MLHERAQCQDRFADILQCDLEVRKFAITTTMQTIDKLKSRRPYMANDHDWSKELDCAYFRFKSFIEGFDYTQYYLSGVGHPGFCDRQEGDIIINTWSVNPNTNIPEQSNECWGISERVTIWRKKSHQTSGIGTLSK